MRYSNTGKNKENGVVYTPEEMANYVAKEILNYRTSAFDSEISILDIKTPRLIQFNYSSADFAA